MDKQLIEEANDLIEENSASDMSINVADMINNSSSDPMVGLLAAAAGVVVSGIVSVKITDRIMKRQIEPILTKIYNFEIAKELSVMIEFNLSSFKTMFKIIPIQKAYNVAYRDIKAFFKDEASLKNKKLRKKAAVSYYNYIKVNYDLGMTDRMKSKLDPTMVKIEQFIKKL